MKRNEDWSGCDTAYESLAKAYEQRDAHTKQDSRSIGEAGAALGRELAKVKACFSALKEFGKVRAEHYPKLTNVEVSRWMKWADVPKEERMNIYEKSAAMNPEGLLKQHRESFCNCCKTPPADAKPKAKTKPQAKPAEKDASPGWELWAYEEGMLPSVSWGASTRKFRDQVRAEYPDIDLSNPNEQKFRDMCAELRVGNAAAKKRYAKLQKPIVEEMVAEADAMADLLSTSAQARLEAAVRKHNKVVEKIYAQRYWADIDKQVKRRVDEAFKKEWQRVKDITMHAKRLRTEAANMEHRAQAAFNKDPDKVVLLMDKKDFQKLVGIIHPDRYPENLRPQIDKAMSMLNSARVLH